jgi:hypothetical protein
MREVKAFVQVILILFLAIFSKASYLWGLEKETHAYLNEQIVQKYSIVPDVLENQLGFKQRIMEVFAGKRVIKWFQDAGRYEDEPAYSRSFNHFHDPLQPWYLAGFDKTFKSSLIWAQDQGMIGSLFGGDWSWKKARNSFYKGLTSITKTEKEKNLADTFRALGQIMHLIQDASVPAHVRNDPHVYINLFGKKIGRYHYEVWVGANMEKIPLHSQGFNKSILNITPEPIAPLPIANIFDTNRYDGSNLNIAMGTGIGITEYANANFFSEGTIFKNYPHPMYSDTNFFAINLRNPEIIDAEDGKLDQRIYIKKTAGEAVQRLASLSYISYECIKKGHYEFSPIILDDKVYEEYASKLIPRAVGYSAGLLDYFFRGKLQVTAVPIFHNNSIVYLRLKIKNMTPNETMIGGIFRLTYSYRPAGGNPDGSQDIWDQSPVVASGVLEYGGDDQHPVEDTVVDFWLPIPIPRENYDSAKFTLAFKGTLGNEGGAVIGKALTLGEVKFEEEWNNGLSGNHNWAHTGINLLGQNPDNGSTSNVLTGDTLVKDNIRYVGRKTARVNESYVGYDALNNEFVDILPIRITPNTYIQFKIDEMWINQRTPAPPGYTNDWQHLLLRFNNGLGIQYSTQEQGVYLGSKWGSFEFNPDFIIVDNIYDLFKVAGIPIPAGDLYLRNIAFIQQLSILDENSVVEHHQHMKIDSLRIIEGKKHE